MIDARAADWAARLDRGALSAAQEEELSAWLAGDIRRRGAFARAMAIADYSNRARALGPDFVPARPLWSSRRTLLRALGGAVAMAASLLLIFQPWQHRLSTGIGEIRRLALEDGSRLTLDTASVVELHYSAERRGVLLKSGEAFFEVAKNSERPFIVESGDTVVRAVGTAFMVRNLPNQPVEVLVQEGKVEITRRSHPEAPPVFASANVRAVSPGQSVEPTVTRVETGEVKRRLAWRDGIISFQGDSLQQAAETFARYSPQHIVITDPDLANRTVTGLFASNNPKGFSEAVAGLFGAKVSVNDHEIVLERK